MSTLVDDPQAIELLLLLWNAADREAGVPIIELPEPLRDEALLSACHGDQLVEFVRRNHSRVGAGFHQQLVIEAGWSVAELHKPNRKPVWVIVREALSEQVEDEIRYRVRLSNRGCDLTGALSRKANAAIRLGESEKEFAERLHKCPAFTRLSDDDVAKLSAWLRHNRPTLAELRDAARGNSPPREIQREHFKKMLDYNRKATEAGDRPAESHGQFGVREANATTSSLGSTADNAQKPVKKMPDNPDVRDLCAELEKNAKKPSGKKRSEMQVALDFARDNEKKAKNLLRQARRYPHLWKT